MADTDWKQMSDWHWIGPEGWTICKVWIDGKHQFEIWRPGGQQEDVRPTLKAAQARYSELRG